MATPGEAAGLLAGRAPELGAWGTRGDEGADAAGIGRRRSKTR
jgi:hypothetical protein